MAQQWREPSGATGRAGPRDAGTWPAVAGTPAEPLRKARRWLAITGVLAILAGILAVVVPAAASVTIAIFIGWILVFAGVVMLAHAWRHPEAREPLRLLNAALTLLIGLYLLIFPLHGTVTLTFMLAVWFFAIGALELLAAWRGRGLPGVGFMAFHGAVSLLLGILIAVDLPSSGKWAIGLLVGINLLLWGVRALVLSSVLRRVFEA
jgi:uncharacterized membrane protein HdeD (DUF308 family)